MDDAEAYLHAGGNLVLPVASLKDCLRLAEAAHFGGVHLTLVGRLSRQDMISVAHAGGKHVTFDLAQDTINEHGIGASGERTAASTPH
ncbi:MAG TPA: hypothetical protein VNW15_05610 [Rhizomicrobium sp.]|nr:hypothetical protein [Rhizomicrobium sp.]